MFENNPQKPTPTIKPLGTVESIIFFYVWLILEMKALLKRKRSTMKKPRRRLQIAKNQEVTKAIETIRECRPGLINDSMVVTSALIEYALALEAENTPPAPDDKIKVQSKTAKSRGKRRGFPPFAETDSHLGK